MACIIVDIDGTLADTRHRLHYLAGTPKDWKGFYGALGEDGVYKYVDDLVNALLGTYRVYLVTGRPENYREQTQSWLRYHNIDYYELLMRKSGDFRPDTIIKKEILEALREEGQKPQFAIDDRPEVVKMWRDNGVPCLQVDPSPWFAPIKDNEDLLEWLAWMKSQHHEPMYDKVADEIRRLRLLEDAPKDEHQQCTTCLHFYAHDGQTGVTCLAGNCPFSTRPRWVDI